MKKIFTLIGVALMVISTNAQSWNFSTWEAKTFAKGSTETIDGLTVNPSEKDIVIDGNNKTVDGVKYTQRLKFGGSGSPTTQNISFDVSGAGTLKVIVTSSSGSEDRKFGVALEGTEIAEKDAKGGAVEAVTVNITGAGKVAIYGKGGVNLYLVEFTAGGGSGGSATGETESYLAVKEDGSAASTEFANPTASGTDLIVNVATANVTLKAVASKTPARSQTAGMTEETWDKWNDANWDGPKKQNDIQFYWMQGSGNPYISFQSKTIINNDEPTGDYDPDYTYYVALGKQRR